MLKLEAMVSGSRHVIWDWNGTLLSDLDATVASVNSVLGEERLPPITREHFRDSFRFPVRAFFDDLGLDTAAENFARLVKRFGVHFGLALASCDLWPGARQLLANIKASGRTQSLLSLTEHHVLEDAVGRLGLRPYFDHVVGGLDNLAASKVARGHELMARAGVPARETVLIGDTDHDLEVGRALGCDVILVDHGHQTPGRLKALHDRVVTVL